MSDSTMLDLYLESDDDPFKNQLAELNFLGAELDIHVPGIVGGSSQFDLPLPDVLQETSARNDIVFCTMRDCVDAAF